MRMKDFVGGNRSGTARNPERTREQMEPTGLEPEAMPEEAQAIADVRVEYARASEPAATMPPPAGVKQLAKKAVRALTGTTDPLLDKLGERLAYERAGVRLYDALLSKIDAFGKVRGGPTRADVEHVRDEELEHFALLRDTIERLGGDPTAVTPSANVQATASNGIMAVLTDPRIDLQQSLEAMLIVELADNDCWAALAELATAAGDTEAASAFERALENERAHLALVRAWVAAGQGRSVDGIPGAAEVATVRSARTGSAKAKRSARRGGAGTTRAGGTAANRARRKGGAKKKAAPAAKRRTKRVKATAAKSRPRKKSAPRGGGKRGKRAAARR